MCVEGPLPPCAISGLAWMATIGGGSRLMTACMPMLGPLDRLWVIGGDVDIGPPAMVMLENGSGFALAMGLDGEWGRLSIEPNQAS